MLPSGLEEKRCQPLSWPLSGPHPRCNSCRPRVLSQRPQNPSPVSDTCLFSQALTPPHPHLGIAPSEALGHHLTTSPSPFQLPLPSRPWLFFQHSLAPSGSRTLKSWVLGDPTPGPENPRVQQWDGGGSWHSLSLEASDSFWTWIPYRRNPFPACPHQTPTRTSLFSPRTPRPGPSLQGRLSPRTTHPVQQEAPHG